MIILDSNILKGISLRDAEAELLRVIRAADVEQVVVPWIVMEELAAQQALAYQTKHEKAAAAMEALNKATPWEHVRLPKKAKPEYVRRHWRERYAHIVGTIETSPNAYQQALFREANLLAPCKTVNSGKNKTGARDAAIWLTAVEYAREHPKETVYFISNNTEDFGDGSSFKPPLDEDLKGLEERFVLYTSLDGVLNQFAAQSDAPEEEVTALLDTKGNRNTIAREMRKERSFSGLTLDESGQPEPGYLRGWLGPLGIALSTLSDIRAHEIAGHKWVTATARWLISGLAFTIQAPGFEYASCSWTTRVLLSPNAPNEGLTILRGDRLEPTTPEDAPNIVLPVRSELENEVFRAIVRGRRDRLNGHLDSRLPTDDSTIDRFLQILGSY